MRPPSRALSDPFRSHLPLRSLLFGALLTLLGCFVPNLAAATASPPRLFLIGGSTMATFPPERPVVGWGQMLPEFFRAPGIVQNRARSGRSSKSFIDQGLWAAVLAELQAGDSLIICFGTNDSKRDDPARYTEPRGSFRANLERLVRETRAKEAIPILATSVARRQWDGQGNFVAPPSEWVEVTREVATARQVPLMEMRLRTAALERQLGPEGSIALHLYLPPGKYAAYPKGAKDDTHYCADGARRVAALAADELRRLDLPVARWLLDPLPVAPVTSAPDRSNAPRSAWPPASP